MTTFVSYPHGLGDCVYFAHQLPLYQRRGHDIRIVCNPDKRCLFPQECVVTDRREAPKIAWNHARHLESVDDGNFWMANKAMHNFSTGPMPDIGLPSRALWDEFTAEKVRLPDPGAEMARKTVEAYFAGLEGPVVLFHSKGNSFQKAKSVPDELAVEIYRSILEETGGTLLLLDWDNRVPRIAHGRIKHMMDDWMRLGVPELLAAIDRADLLVGIDSGPLHLCRFTETPAVGLWFEGHHPSMYSLPRKNQVNITLKKNAPRANKHTRWFYNIIEEHGAQIRASTVGRTCRQLLGGARYLPGEELGRDVMMRHWLTDYMRGGVSASGTFIDRDESFDRMLRHLAGFERPQIVETGCIRAEEDWRGAGFSTYLLGAYAAACGGWLESVDIGAANCAFAQKWTRIFGAHVNVRCADSLHYLASRSEPVDLLFLDSWDTYVPGFAEHGLREIQAAERLLHSRSMVVYDDTSILGGKWQGKGTLGVPWMIERGWRPVFAGHQTILLRP